MLMTRTVVFVSLLVVLVAGCATPQQPKGRSTTSPVLENEAALFVERAKVKLRARDYQGASIDCTEAILRRPELAEAYLYRGVVRHFLGALDDAIEDYDRAISLQPNNAEAFFDRGNARLRKNELWSAMRDYDAAVAVNAKYVPAYVQRAHLNIDMGQYDRAIADANIIIGLHPENATAYQIRGVARRWIEEKSRNNDFRLALDDLTQAIALQPENAAAYFERGTARQLATDFAGANPHREGATILVT
jgi:tetratricopeptide (TPR) repeat protein